MRLEQIANFARAALRNNATPSRGPWLFSLALICQATLFKKSVRPTDDVKEISWYAIEVALLAA